MLCAHDRMHVLFVLCCAGLIVNNERERAQICVNICNLDGWVALVASAVRLRDAAIRIVQLLATTQHV